MSQDASSKMELNWRRDEAIAVPSPDRERRMAVRFSDWQRIKRNCSRVEQHTSSLSIAYSILFGVAASAGLSIIPICGAKDLPAWVCPLYICVFLFSSLCGFVLLRLEARMNARRTDDLHNVLTDMEEIEAMFPRGQGSE